MSTSTTLTDAPSGGAQSRHTAGARRSRLAGAPGDARGPHRERRVRRRRPRRPRRPTRSHSVRREQPDLVLIDIGYPEMAGIGVGKALRHQIAATPIVFCSIADDEDTAIRALRVGAAGYVSKDLESGAAAPGAARSPRRRGRDLAPARAPPGRGALRQPSRGRACARSGGELTAREWEVLDLLIDGESTPRSPRRSALRSRRCAATSSTCCASSASARAARPSRSPSGCAAGAASRRAAFVPARGVLADDRPHPRAEDH